MNMRRLTSLTALASFSLIMLTSVILYIVPYGRVAYWADWRLWGLTKTKWSDLHLTVGFLFLISIVLHLYYNWKPMVAYLKNRKKQLRIFTREFNAAVLVLLIWTVGTYADIPPFSLILNLSESIKETAAKQYGEPPYGHAELSSLKTFSKKMGLDLPDAANRLNAAGIAFESDDQRLLDIARANHVSPQQVYRLMAPPKTAAMPAPLPVTPSPGFGNRKLADICQEYGLNIGIVVSEFGKSGIAAHANMSLKEIAQQADSSPLDVYHRLKSISASAQS